MALELNNGTFILTLKLLFTLIFIVVSQNSYASPSETLEELLQEYKGDVVYVDFWASWCTPCRKSFPWMNELQTQHQNLRIISINVDQNKGFAAEFLKETPANFPIIYDPKGVLAKKYKLRGMPSSYIFNKKGQLTATHVGFNKKKQQKYEVEIKALLNE